MIEADARAAARSSSAMGIDFLCLRLAEAIASLAIPLGSFAGCFTAGIGESVANIGERVAGHLKWLGLSRDKEANGRHATRIAAADSRVLFS